MDYSTFKKIIICSIAFTHFFFFQQVFAEISPYEILTKNYLDRVKGAYKNVTDIIVVNPESVITNAITESIDTISKVTQERTKDREKFISAVDEIIKKDFQLYIEKIEEKNTNILIDDFKKQFEEIRIEILNTLKIEQVFFDENKIDEIKNYIETKIEELEVQDEKTKKKITFEFSSDELGLLFEDFLQTEKETKTILESRNGLLVFKDSDNDLISDYDELYIYKTDSENAKTKGDSLTDGEKIAKGINPINDTESRIYHESAQQDMDSFVSSSYTLNSITNQEEGLMFSGTALPNSFITLYIYRDQIIRTLKTNMDGSWSYVLDKKIKDGEHQLYIATVDAFGKIIVRSNPILFTKTNDEVLIGIGHINSEITTKEFIKDNIIIISIFCLIIVTISLMIYIGNHSSVQSAIRELKNHVGIK